jgi:NTP pyrophosphatase (non-canonical NTP hydrolase)
MLSDAYQASCLKTESLDIPAIRERLQDETVIRLLHSAMGNATEGGELMDILKKHIFYGKPLDDDKLVHAMEELGDILWYVSVGSDALKQKLSTVMERNIAKLSARYPGKFQETAALQRNLKAEAAALGHSPDYSEVEMNPNE